MKFSTVAFSIVEIFGPPIESKVKRGLPMEDARDLIDKVVLVKLESNEGLGFIGVPDEGPVFCRVVAVDEIGLWVENKNFVTIEIRDSKGRFVPKEEQVQERHVVNLLLPWRCIQTVVMFAEQDADKVARDILGEEGEEGKIGFVT